MRSLSLLAVGLLCLSVLSCNRKPSGSKDQVSYTIGAQFGKSLKAQNLELDPKMVARGIQDGIKGSSLALSEEEMQAAMIKLNESRQKDMRVVADKNKSESEAFLDKNKTAEGVKVTASGLQYKILAEGEGPSPKENDTVVVNYKGTLIDGKEFDSSYKHNAPAEFPVNAVIPGWVEGLHMMKKGGKAIFFIPPELGYGDQARQTIPANATLIFDVELVDIRPGKGKVEAKAESKKSKK